MKAYPKLNLFYLYSIDDGIYAELTPQELKTLLLKVLKTISKPMANVTNLEGIYKLLYYGDGSHLGVPEFDTHLVVLKNGTYDLNKQIFREWSPNDFVKSKVDYIYDPHATCPNILHFLKFFCSNHEDRLHFLRCWLWALQRSYTEAQIFLYIMGPGGTGKSVFANLTTAFIGKESAITTSLKVLNSDRFEITNLVGKKLISIVDSTFYKGDVSVLKMLTGGDSLMGRTKYAQGFEEGYKYSRKRSNRE